MDSFPDAAAALSFLCFAIALVAAPFAFIGMLRAKTRMAYWRHVALFAGPIMLTFALRDLVGLDEPRPTPPPMPPPAEFLQDIVSQTPTAALAFLAAGALLWLGGVNFYMRRYMNSRIPPERGVQKLLGFFLDPPFRHFAARDWLVIGLLAVGSLALSAVGISLANNR